MRLSGSYYYAINIGADMPEDILNHCYNYFEIEHKILQCLNYNDIESMTVDQFREMIANGNDA